MIWLWNKKKPFSKRKRRTCPIEKKHLRPKMGKGVFGQNNIETLVLGYSYILFMQKTIHGTCLHLFFIFRTRQQFS